MRKLRKNVYFTAGYYTIAMGSGRPEFHPKNPRPSLEDYVLQAGKAILSSIPGKSSHIDECYIGNFMASHFCKQSHLGGLMPMISDDLKYKPCTRVEGACASGGVALSNAIKAVLSDLSDVVLVMGAEVQNSVKALYGADYLAQAGHFASERKEGDAFFFPGVFSKRAGLCYQKYGKEQTRRGMAAWYAQAIEHARTCPEAQEHTNKNTNLVEDAMQNPNPAAFVENLNFLDCSKVSDGAAGILCVSEEGLRRLEIPLSNAVRLMGFSQTQADLTKAPEEPTKLSNSAVSSSQAFAMAGLTAQNIGVLEVHDCFSINGLLMLEAAGFVKEGESASFVANRETSLQGSIPTNTTGGLIGYGHPTGATGVRQMVDLWKQLTQKAGKSQTQKAIQKPTGMMINMGGNDKTSVSIIVGKD
ncbi:MAG: 3-ketoacyl-CoA thiolase [Candidatus Brocadiae bacterium]|nr:3-ketoacyl-CoA thiolase [Candidatus Brocadiia bacterium]